MPTKGLQQLTLIKGFKVKSGVSIKQFQIVKLSADGEVDICGAANAPIGVAQQTRIAKTGITDTVAVGMSGVATCIKTNTALVRGVKVYAVADGFISAVQGTGDKLVGVTIEAYPLKTGGLVSVALDLEKA